MAMIYRAELYFSCSFEIISASVSASVMDSGDHASHLLLIWLGKKGLKYPHENSALLIDVEGHFTWSIDHCTAFRALPGPKSGKVGRRLFKFLFEQNLKGKITSFY